ncbi:MAG: DUF3332 family protein [Spirochaetes bacterium]|nr:MAG: DUF3332 family protein [Spirochaetota bacterium]
MKRSFRLVALALVLCISCGAMISCYGSYILWHKVYRWNGTIGNQWARSIVHLLLWIVPVYEICGIIDFLILNTLEFWTGSNPLAMAPGESETQIVMAHNEAFEITATRNRFDIRQMSGVNAGRAVALVYEPDTLGWYIETPEQNVKVAQMEEGNIDFVNLIFPDSSVERVAIR